MKKLDLKFGSIKEMLSKDQMKQISGGCATCTWSANPGCDGVGITYPCNYSPDYCQGFSDAGCETDDCCDGVDCV